MKLLLWKLSSVILAGASAADTASSIGRPELNPILAQHGQFTGQSAAIKCALTGGAIGFEYWMIRKHPNARRPMAVTNFALSGVLAGAAIHNLRTE